MEPAEGIEEKFQQEDINVDKKIGKFVELSVLT